MVVCYDRKQNDCIITGCIKSVMEDASVKVIYSQREVPLGGVEEQVVEVVLIITGGSGEVIEGG